MITDKHISSNKVINKCVVTLNATKLNFKYKTINKTHFLGTVELKNIK